MMHQIFMCLYNQSINKYNICALLAHGAMVDEKMILASGGYMKKLLQQKDSVQN